MFKPNDTQDDEDEDDEINDQQDLKKVYSEMKLLNERFN